MYSGPTQTDRIQIDNDTFGYGTLGLTLHAISGQGTTEFVRCSCGLLNNERTPDGQKYYYLFDGLGSIIGMTDSSGGLKNSSSTRLLARGTIRTRAVSATPGAMLVATPIARLA